MLNCRLSADVEFSNFKAPRRFAREPHHLQPHPRATCRWLTPPRRRGELLAKGYWKPHPRAASRLTPPLREGSDWPWLLNSSLFVLHSSLPRRQPFFTFLPFYLFTFLPLKVLFTFKSPFKKFSIPLLAPSCMCVRFLMPCPTVGSGSMRYMGVLGLAY